MRRRERHCAIRLVAAPSNQDGAELHLIVAHQNRAAGGAIAGLAIEREFAGTFLADGELVVQPASFHRHAPTVTPIDVATRHEFDRRLRLDQSESW